MIGEITLTDRAAEKIQKLLAGANESNGLRVDNDKCIGCQMCFSDDLTKIHRHKETGEIFREYAGRYYDSSKKPLEKEAVPKKFQLELIGTESEDRLDKKICPWDAIKMYEFDEGVEVSKYFYEPKAPDAVKGFYVTTVAEKQRLEEKQLELYENAG
jgi:ferredoxin